MAFSTTVVVTLAGDNSFNGTYNLQVGITNDGYPTYVLTGSPNKYLYHSHSLGFWVFYSGSIVDGNSPDYGGGGSSAGPDSALGLYSNAGAAAPAPTVVSGVTTVSTKFTTGFQNLLDSTFTSGSSTVSPSGVTATYSAGVGVVVSWTIASGFTPIGHRVYRLANNSVNGVFEKVSSVQPYGADLGNVTTFTDRAMGFPGLSSGGNTFKYCVTAIKADGTESLPSPLSSAATFSG